MILSFTSGEITKNLIQFCRMVNIGWRKTRVTQKSRTTFREEASCSEMGLDAETGVARKSKEKKELGGYLNMH